METLQPYTGRQCPDCGKWIRTDRGPFAEGDRTKTLLDLYHFIDAHGNGDLDMAIPFFPWNADPVEYTIADSVATVKAYQRSVIPTDDEVWSSQRGEILCGKHLRRMVGSDTWEWDRWVKATKEDLAEWQTWLEGAEPCEGCRWFTAI